MKPILEVQNISKKYRIQHLSGGYLSLRERMVNALKFEKNNVEDFWALNDVSFSVNPGESVGIIGRNGAGKSTLLKVLSKITPPTSGSIVSRGRVASLLEVGTGFHPELTGRENIYFNGSLLGMKRFEIDSKFDEIVDFSGVEKFLDTPLKHFSSGMQLRLAFAVAAFLEPEILIIDEVLAVGDAEFQKKCLGKMEDVSKSGRTILFVSHQLGMVGQLCKNALLLDRGKIVCQGEVNEIINVYTNSYATSNTFVSKAIDMGKSYIIQQVQSLNNFSQVTSNFAHNEEIVLEIVFLATQLLRNTHLMVSVNNRNGQRVFSSDKALDHVKLEMNLPTTVRITIPKTTLTPGNYTFFVALHCPNTMGYDVADNICPISIYDNGSEFVQYENKWFYGDVYVSCKWEFKSEINAS
ncbi:ABC transporter ATP-binding protein [Chryseotalea sanaruensis]|uniref:ABC transporter ATP-binding protein n=1 Tax=Chryseotalea sanaruensis TaxID=2482724 RepID=A0A401UAW0_9BACT|nr:ABC transporter ATP-binding protein [Chryseotalea sanaruensis]GCC52043.1 ABC transporter ATP-binding protein [Chryseotalea sanaruensis]